MSALRNPRTLAAAGVLVAAACLTACSGPDRSDPRETADAFAVALVTGDTPAACDLAADEGLDRLTKYGWCEAPLDKLPEVDSLTLVGVCKDSSIYGYRVEPHLTIRGANRKAGNRLVVAVGNSDGESAVLAIYVADSDNPPSAEECPAGFTEVNESVPTD